MVSANLHLYSLYFNFFLILLLHFLSATFFLQPKTQIKNPGIDFAYVNLVDLKLKLTSVLDPPRCWVLSAPRRCNGNGEYLEAHMPEPPEENSILQWSLDLSAVQIIIVSTYTEPFIWESQNALQIMDVLQQCCCYFWIEIWNWGVH